MQVEAKNGVTRRSHRPKRNDASVPSESRVTAEAPSEGASEEQLTLPVPEPVPEAASEAAVPVADLATASEGAAPVPEHGAEPVAGRVLDLALVHESPLNPRKRFGDLEDLTASVRAKGVLQPVLVRPHPTMPGHYELAAGARRYRASCAAGLVAIPATVRELTDLELVEVAVIENNQRRDVHPLEEADGFEALRAGGYTVPEIAKRISRSDGYVYQRLKLRELGEAGRESFFEGQLDAAKALLIARLPAQLQAEALAGITRPHSPMAFREASDFVRRRYMLRVLDAGFSLDDSDLLPSAGSCTSCPKRTANDSTLEEDLRTADLCLDPPCMKAKRDAEADRRIALGARKLELPKGQRLQIYSGRLYSDSLVLLDGAARSASGKEKPWREVLGEDAPAPMIGRDDDGRIVEVLPKREVIATLKEDPKRATWLASLPGHDPEEKRRAAKARQEKARNEEARKAREEGRGRVIEGAVAIAERASSVAVWRAVAFALASEYTASESITETTERRQIDRKDVPGWIGRAPEPALSGFVLELCLRDTYGFGGDEGLENVFRAIGVDRARLERGESTKAKPAKATKPGKKPGKGKKR